MRFPFLRPGLVLVSLAGLTLAAMPAAHAGPILQPASASTNMGSDGSSSPNNTRNQSGLSVPYTSLVTDFDAYIASNPTHNSDLGPARLIRRRPP